jgi:hypothetical protein
MTYFYAIEPFMQKVDSFIASNTKAHTGVEDTAASKHPQQQ